MSDETKYFVYKLICDELEGLFYIGSHHCTGKATTCKGEKCRYMGNSSIIKKQYADYSWHREVVKYAQNRKELALFEIEYIKANIDDLLCLNQVIASPAKGPQYSKSAKRRLKQSVRRNFVLMIDLDGDEVPVHRDKMFEALQKGYEIRSPNIHLINNRLQQCGHFSSSTVSGVYQWIKSEGWTFGYNGEYQKITASDLLSSIGVIRETTVTINYIKVTA
jgi:hypothetical protein